MLSKSLFKLGLECPLRLKHALTRPALPRKSDEDEYMQMLARGGYMFEKLVRIYHPGEDMYVPKESHAAASARTLAKIKAGDCTLHETTFTHGDLMARTDMIRVHGSFIDLIEIKSASAEADAQLETEATTLNTKAWQPYVIDLAFQVHVAGLALKAAGIDKTIRACFYLPNKNGIANAEECRGLFSITEQNSGGRPEVVYKGNAQAGDASSLIAIVDATEAVASAHPQEHSIAEATATLSGFAEGHRWPSPELGLKCKSCEFNVPGQTSGYDLCWGTQARAEHHLFTLGFLGNLERGNPGTIQRIIAQAAPRAPQITDLQDEDIVGDGKLQRTWKRQIMAVRTGRPFLSPELAKNPAGLMRCLPEHYPLYFLDYEGTRWALPSAPGCRPYGQVAFQWSCHVIDNPGASPRHVEWLDTESENPNVGFLESLRRVLGEQGTIYHWSSYEITITQELADEIRGDASKADLVSWVDRNWGTPGSKKTAVKSERTLDLLEISRGHFYDPAMKGSHSIKAVLPVIWKNPTIQKLFPKYAVDQHGKAVKNPYEALPALTLEDSAKGSPIDLTQLEAMDIVKNGTGAIRAYEHVRYGLAAGQPAERKAIRRQLMRYCELDTAAMIMIWKHWVG